MTEPRRFGPLATDNGVMFRLWAPAARQVALVEREVHEMQSLTNGWFGITLSDARAGLRYKFRVDDDIEVPDPASRFQPDDVHGPSELVDPAFDWQASTWKGLPWHHASILELHVGTFTEAGTFGAVIDKLEHVADAGFSAIELMPVADFAGRWNWGYDGVLPFAPDSAYGRPDDLKALVDAAHRCGLMVFLDVVYNHFGPDGNYLGRYAPAFTAAAQTPWGSAIDYEVPEVCAFAVENALYWLDDFRFDGLRLDAMHAIVEPGRSILLKELSTRAGALAAASGRHIHLVLENDNNEAHLLDPAGDPPRGKYRAQWNDDYHHAFHVLLTGETMGYYRDYRDAAQHLARTLAEGFAYQGEPSPHRGGASRGEPTGNTNALAFVNFLQNHDQIGNRALGERLTALAPRAALDAALAITLLAPMPPLLFMGDEWGAREPFPFFCDFSGELAKAVRDGRREEFSDAYTDPNCEIPDPLSEQTVRLATLDWTTIAQPEHRERLDLVRRLLAVRNELIVPRLTKLQPGPGDVQFDDEILTASWKFRSGETLVILANLSNETKQRPHALPAGKAIWNGPAHEQLAAWSVYAALGLL